MKTTKNEHFVPNEGLDLMHYIAVGHKQGVHHLVRYTWATKVIADAVGSADLLDLGCGAGYGSYSLAQSFPSLKVVGTDYDPVGVAHGVERYSLPNLSYVCGDVTRWDETLGNTMYD